MNSAADEIKKVLNEFIFLIFIEEPLSRLSILKFNFWIEDQCGENAKINGNF